MLRWSCGFVFKGLKLPVTNQLRRWNHYKSLGLTPSATLAEIKAAYYKLSKIYHPDRNNGSEASARKFRDIVAAYEVLSKAVTRKQYDREIMGIYEARKSDSGSKKKISKKVKKSSKFPKPKSHFKSDFQSKFKQSSGSGGRKSVRRRQDEDFDKFFLRAIPIVVACLMAYRKH